MNGRPIGRMPCPYGQEYNHHQRMCMPYMSPTCTRNFPDPRRCQAPLSCSGAAPAAGEKPQSDQPEGQVEAEPSPAPQDMYYDDVLGLTPFERRDIYLLNLNEQEYVQMQEEE